LLRKRKKRGKLPAQKLFGDLLFNFLWGNLEVVVGGGGKREARQGY